MREKGSVTKSLRWLAYNFPYNDSLKDNADRMANAIHVYAASGAEKIEDLEKKVKDLEAEKKQYDYIEAVREVINLCLEKGKGIVKRKDCHGA